MGPAIDTDFVQASVSIGVAHNLTIVIGRHPSSDVMGVEIGKDGDGLDVIIGLHGKNSEPNDTLRVSSGVLIGALALARTRGNDPSRLQALIERTHGLVNGPIALIRNHGTFPTRDMPPPG